MVAAQIAWCEECGSFECGQAHQAEHMGRELRLALRRLAESDRRAAWWRSQGETDAADRYAAEARSLREGLCESAAERER
jgi:hypothetical protein